MKIFFINNHGGGFAREVHVSAGTSVAQFFVEHMAGKSAGDYVTQVNGTPPVAELILQEGDTVSVTPTQIKGANCARG